MSLNDRLCPPPNEKLAIIGIEVSFSIPVFLSVEQDRELSNLIGEIVESRYNQPTEGVHWVSGYGSKPNYSRMDAIFLGLKPDPEAPEDGEPTYNDSIYQIVTTAREFVSDSERYNTKLERDQHPNPVPEPVRIDKRPSRRSYSQHDERLDTLPEGTIIRDHTGVVVHVRQSDCWLGFDFSREVETYNLTYPVQVIWVPETEICTACNGVTTVCETCGSRGWVLPTP